ncbi:hypothetical protein [Aliivibrio fischeri]|uniref:hypothetical protein n=1 Tax=Aliivibrio fischeri TaxID=668 RepID=UPI0007C592F4|nr:hypothetical protein [Aliivibrio fischeri]
MKLLIALVVGLSIGFGTGYMVFHAEVEKHVTITLNDVDKMQLEDIREILTNKSCEKISHQTIQCKI